MILVVEIGGTKLQLAVFDPQTKQLNDCRRLRIQAEAGAQGILQQIAATAPSLLEQYPLHQCGIGFGGPVRADGSVYKSHQIAGWDGFDLAGWMRQTTGLATRVANDCDAAAMAEAHFGAGQGWGSVFYVTVGTGVGGGWVVEGQRVGADRPAVAEIGHLRPGLACRDPAETVESFASGWGITRQTQRLAAEIDAWLDQGRLSFDTFTELSHLAGPIPEHDQLQASLDWYRALAHDLTAEHVAVGAAQRLWLPQAALELATTVLGWAIAQAVTIAAPQRVIIGGGVSKLSESLFWEPVRRSFQQYAFGPLRETTEIVPAVLGDDVVLFGAAAIAAELEPA